LNTQKPKSWRRRILLWLSWIIGLLLLCAVVGVLGAETLITKALSEALGVPVAVEGLELSWSDAIRTKRVTVPDPAGAAMLDIHDLRLPGGLSHVAFSSEALRCEVSRLSLRLCPAADGGSNVESVVQGLPKSQADNTGSGVGRRLELSVEQGVLLVEDQHVLSFKLVGSLEADGQHGRARVEAQTTDGGKLTLGAIMASVKDEEPRLSVELRGETLSAARLLPLVQLWSDTNFAGTARRIVVQAELAGSMPVSVALEAELENVSVGAAEAARPVPELRLRGECAFGAGQPRTASLHVETSAGFANLSTKAPLEFTAQDLAGDLAVEARLHDAGLISSALQGLLPDGVELSGALQAEGQVRGRWQKGSQNLLDQLRAVTGSLKLQCDGLRTPWCALRDIELDLFNDGRALDLQRVVALADGVRLSGRVSVPFDGSRVEGALTIEGELPVAFEADGKRCAAGLSGVIRCQGTAEEAAMQLDLRARRLVLDLAATPVVLDEADIKGGLRFSQGFSVLDASNVALTCTEGSVQITDAHWEQPSASFRAALRADWSADALAPWLAGVCVPEGRLQVECTLTGRGSSLTALESECALRLERCVFQERVMQDLVCQARIAGGKAILNSCTLRYGGGTITVSGQYSLDASADLALNVALSQVLVQERVGAADIRGAFSGALQVESEGGDALRLRGQVSAAEVLLKRLGVPDIPLSGVEARVRGGRDGSRWFVEHSSVTAKQGALEINEATVNTEVGVAAVDARWNLDGAWLAAVASAAGVEGVDASGASEGRVQLRSAQCTVPHSWHGTVDLSIPRLVVVDREFQALTVHAALEGARMKLREARCGHRGGTLRLAGNFGLDPAAAGTADELDIEIMDFPLEYVAAHEEDGFQGEMVTTARLSGRFHGRRKTTAPAEVDLDLNISACARSLRDQRRVLASAPIAPLHVSAKGRLAEAGLEALHLEVRGDGLSLSADDVSVSATDLRCGKLELRAGPALLHALLLSKDGASVVQQGELHCVGAVSMKSSDWVPQADSLTGQASCLVDGLNAGKLQFTRVEVQGSTKAGVTSLAKGSAQIAGGTLVIAPGAALRLDANGCHVQFQVEGRDLDLAKLPNHELAILSPLFFLGDRPTKDAKVAGKLGLMLSAQLTDGQESWRKTTNADGRIEIRGLELVSTSMFLEVMDQLPGLFGARLPRIGGFDVQGALQSIQAAMRQGVKLERLASGVTVRKGRLSLDRNLAMPMAGIMLTLNGSTGLDGSMNARIDTDVMQKLAERAAPTGGVLGALLGATGLLSKLQLGIEMQGNIFATNKAEGLSVRPVLGGI
jgi:hypothetical protein